MELVGTRINASEYIVYHPSHRRSSIRYSIMTNNILLAYVLELSYRSCYCYRESGTSIGYWVGSWEVWNILWRCFLKSNIKFKNILHKLADFGEIEDLSVCENICDHLVGNVYIKYTKEEYAEKCMSHLLNMQYEGRPL